LQSANEGRYFPYTISYSKLLCCDYWTWKGSWFL